MGLITTVKIMKTTFIGHRILLKNIDECLEKAIEKQIKCGCLSFIVGSHGQFDELVLKVLRKLKTIYKQIQIEVVITSLEKIKKYHEYVPYSDVKTLMYEIEDIFFKRRITYSNKKMIDECDTLICYVDNNLSNSGAKSIMKYAEKKGLNVTNLFDMEN